MEKNFLSFWAKIADLFSREQFLEKLIFLTLILNLLTVIVFDGFKYFYNFDEFVVTNVSMQPFPMLFETLLSEPHPPGMYLLLKFFGQFFPPYFWLKIALKVLSYLLFGLGVCVATKTKVLSKFKLHYGILLFFLTFNTLTITSHLKQDIISIPLLFLLCILCLLKTADPKKPVLHFTTYFVLTLIFFFSYLNYFFGAILILSQEIWQIIQTKKVRPISILFAGIHGTIVGLSILIFSFSQYQFNQTRFEWVSNLYNSYLSLLSYQLIGSQLSDVVADSSVLLFLGAVIASYVAVKEGRISKKTHMTAVCAVGAFCVFSYTFKLFVQDRYSTPILFVLCILAGWGLTTKMAYHLVFWILLALFSFKTIYYVQLNYLLQKSVVETAEYIKTSTTNEQTGIVSNSPLGVLYYKLQFFRDDENLVAINAQFPGLYEQTTSFGKEQLFHINTPLSADEQFLNKRFSETKLSRFIYLNISSATHYDPDQKLFSLLQKQCHSTQQALIEHTNIRVYTFDQCNFN